MRKMNKLTFVTLPILLLSILLSSCKADDVEPSPEIPPESTMNIDFSDFSSGEADRIALDTNNWLSAAIPVAFWKIALTVTYVVPVTAHKAALSQGATFIEAGKWQWSFDHKVGLVNYTAVLTATRVSGGHNWEMRLSKQGGFQNHLWYSGFSANDLQSGYWKLYRAPANGGNEALRVDWTRNSSGSVATVKHQVSDATDAGFENYIEYGINEDATHNAYFDVYQKSKNLLIEIDWHRTNKNGRIKNEEYFTDTDWNCWDTTLKNTSCE